MDVSVWMFLSMGYLNEKKTDNITLHNISLHYIILHYITLRIQTDNTVHSHLAPQGLKVTLNTS